MARSLRKELFFPDLNIYKTIREKEKIFVVPCKGGGGGYIGHK